MISVDEALEKLGQHPVRRPALETVPLEHALNRICAENAVSKVDVPPADNSSMDGYAVNAEHLRDTHAFIPVSQRIAAGTAPEPLVAGSAARIFTGAEIPAGADSIVIQENAELDDHSDLPRVRFSSKPKPGDNIRRQGQDVACGQVILTPGHRIRPQEIGMAASCGHKSVCCYTRLRIGLISTGSELVRPGNALKPGQIYNSNTPLLKALCLQSGFEAIDFGIVEDNFDSTKQRLQETSKDVDVIISTGGVSVGEEDHVRHAVEALGSLDLWKIAIKPGKPFALGQIGDTPFIGLPGNPSSVFTTFLVLALPFLFRAQGCLFRAQDRLFGAQDSLFGTQGDSDYRQSCLPALFDRKSVSRREFLRARRTDAGIEIFDNQSSGVLSSAVWGDGFAIQMEGSQINRGDLIPFVSYAELLNG